MGAAKDIARLQKGTLIEMSRNVTQGPAVIDLSYEGGKASGSVKMNGKDQPISADTGGPLFADGSTQLSIAALPLAAGYSAAYRTFDLQKQKAKLMQLKVTGTESVTVPAGKFEAYKVDVTSADGGSSRPRFGWPRFWKAGEVGSGDAANGAALR